MPKVSVIVPVYNVEKYIERCASSLFEQTLQDVEFIFVDDCSSDDSLSILKQLIEKYPHRKEQVHIEQLCKNSGPSIARNVGLSLATGEYIAFCDSDDWVSPEMYESLYKEVKGKGADICYCDFYMVFPDIVKNTLSVSLSADRIVFLQNYLRQGLTVLWNMIVLRDLYESYHLKFPEGITYCEDFWLSVRLIYFANKIVKVNESLYYYNRRNQTSLLLKSSNRAGIDELNVVLDTIDFFKQKKCIDFYRKELSWRILKCKQDMVLNSREYSAFFKIYPESHSYILSCPDYFCNKKIKILMWMLVHKMSLIVFVIDNMRTLFHKIKGDYK